MSTIKSYADFLQRKTSVKAVVAEFFATAVLCLVGTSTCVWAWELGHARVATMSAGLSALIVAAVFGVAYTTLTYMTAHTSGAQLNPAISVAMMCSGYLSLLQGVVNIVAQMLGAVFASVLLWIMLPHQISKMSHLGGNTVPIGNTMHGAFLAEMIGTLILTLVVLEVRENRKSTAGNAAPLAMGGALFLTLLAFGNFSSGCMNPARAFGPALVSLNLRHLWLFILAPIFGAVCAVPLHLLFESDWDTTGKEGIADGPGPTARRAQLHSGLEHLEGSAQPLLHRGEGGAVRLQDEPEVLDAEVSEVSVNVN